MNCTLTPSDWPAASTPLFSAPNHGLVRVPEISQIVSDDFEADPAPADWAELELELADWAELELELADDVEPPDEHDVRTSASTARAALAIKRVGRLPKDTGDSMDPPCDDASGLTT